MKPFLWWDIWRNRHLLPNGVANFNLIRGNHEDTTPLHVQQEKKKKLTLASTDCSPKGMLANVQKA